jgi:hypothetical protein
VSLSRPVHVRVALNGSTNAKFILRDVNGSNLVLFKEIPENLVEGTKENHEKYKPVPTKY